jgi:hypothetical protein
MKSSTNIKASVLGKNTLAIELPFKLQDGVASYSSSKFQIQENFPKFWN